MKTFEVRQVHKISSLFGILFLIGFMGLLIYLFVGMTTSLGGTIAELILLIRMPLLVFLTGFLLFLAWIGINLAALQKMRLTFDSEKIALESIKQFRFLLPSGYKSFELPYNQIKKVKFEGIGNRIFLIDQGGRKFALYPFLFSKKNGEEILKELQDHLTTQSFEPAMEVLSISALWSRQNKTRKAVVISFLVLYIATTFLDPMFSSRTWLINDWDVNLNPSGFENIWTYSTDLQSTFWVVAWKSSYYRVYHFSDRVESEWKLPKELLGKQYPQAVSSDRSGRAIVWADHGMYFSNNNGWDWIPYTKDVNLERSSVLASGEYAWAINEQHQILKVNALTATSSVIPLPTSAVDKDLQPKSLKRNKYGEILVLMQNDHSSQIYILSFDDTWESQEFSAISSDNIFIQDYFLDNHHALWVLSKEDNNFFVQKIDLRGNVLLMQLPAPSTLESEERGYYKNLLIDSSGRLWVGGYKNFMAVFIPVWDDTAIEIVKYTEDNSAYQGGEMPAIMPDGKIWSFGRRLSTIDSHLANLPSPSLPEWLGSLDWGLIRMALMLIQFLLILVLHLFSAKPVIFQKQKSVDELTR